MDSAEGKATMHRRAPLMAIAFVVLLAGGCTTIIIPPSAPPDPAQVYLLDHGRTPSLVLPRADGSMVRYAFGDWRWYALRQNGLFEGLAAVFLPTHGTLGRRVLPGPPTLDNVRTQVKVGSERIHQISVERAEVEELQAHLDEIFQQNIAGKIVNEPSDFEFVQHPQRYNGLVHNSNHVAAGWLRDLGCRTHGITMLSTWNVRAE
jgi:hypothetical protein